jgi:hypothetical protein
MERAELGQHQLREVPMARPRDGAWHPALQHLLRRRLTRRTMVAITSASACRWRSRNMSGGTRFCLTRHVTWSGCSLLSSVETPKPTDAAGSVLLLNV